MVIMFGWFNREAACASTKNLRLHSASAILPPESSFKATKRRSLVSRALYTSPIPLGAGGMGEVYKARDTRLRRLVALKLLSGGRIADAEWRRRFLVEAQAASRLNHPNIITIHDISEENGVLFIAMEYVVGMTLERAIGTRDLLPDS